MSSVFSNNPSLSSHSIILESASLANSPSPGIPKPFKIFPSVSIVVSTGKFSFFPTSLSSSPNAGAICTNPVPSDASTNSAPTTRNTDSSFANCSIGLLNSGLYSAAIISLPKKVFSVLYGSPLNTSAARDSATTKSWPCDRTTAYDIVGFTATATLPGKVQGVVVQTSNETFSPSVLSVRGRATYTEGSVIFLYPWATSCDDNPVPQRAQYGTTLCPRYNNPFFQS